MSGNGYAASLTVDYPEQSNRLTTAFRIILIIPIAIILGFLASSSDGGSGSASGGWSFEYSGAGLVVIPLALMLIFRRKYPRWWFDWNLELSRFMMRVGAYFCLLRDEYPSTDAEQAVHLDLVYPDAENGLNQWLPIVKWLLAIPHYIVLCFLWIGAIACIVIA